MEYLRGKKDLLSLSVEYNYVDKADHNLLNAKIVG